MGQWLGLYGENKKATFSRECGLLKTHNIPLPYAGIIQVRYEGRPGLDISAKMLP